MGKDFYGFHRKKTYDFHEKMTLCLQCGKYPYICDEKTLNGCHENCTITYVDMVNDLTYVLTPNYTSGNKMGLYML